MALALVLVDMDVRDAAAYERYKELAQASVAAYGGRYVVRGGVVETLEGEWPVSRLVVLEFPSGDQARRWYASPEYLAARAARSGGVATGRFLLVDQGEPLPAPGRARARD